MTTLTKQLAELFRKANQAALSADPGEGLENDGGTCNMDCPAFRVDRARESTIRAAAELAGVEVYAFNWFGGRKWFWLRVTLHGQANRRSRMAEAAARVLRSAAEQNTIPGFNACMYCQAD